MRAIIASFFYVMLSGCGGSETKHHYLFGVWKSNEEMTLDSMNQVDGVTEKARELLEDDFFGNLVVEYREKETRAINEKDDFDTGFLPYEVLEVSEDRIRIKESSEILGETETTIYPEGDCYYVIVSKFEFREYFCRVK